MTGEDRKKFICLLLAAALLAALFPACTREEKKTVSYFDYFDTVITLTAYADDETFAQMSGEAEAEFRRLNRLFDIYNEYEGVNNLASVNRMAGEWVCVDKDVIDLVGKGIGFYKLTEGRVNIAMGAVLKLWHECRTDAENEPEKAHIPAEDELKEAAAHCRIEDVLINAEESAVMLRDPLMSLDVGAVAKGYAEDAAADILKKYERPFILNCGGAVLAYGTKPGNRPWEAGIDDPFGDGFTAVAVLDDCALSTSGSYIRRFSVGGIEYGHIIDPDTLMPSDALESVSVVLTGEGMACTADALSTACFIMGAEDGERLVRGISGAEAVFVYKDGGKKLTEGFPKKADN